MIRLRHAVAHSCHAKSAEPLAARPLLFQLPMHHRFAWLALALLACGPSQDDYADEIARTWCPLAVECEHQYSPSQYDLSSVEACEADVAAKMKRIIGDDNCSYDSSAASDQLDRVAEATCSDYEADYNHLLSPSAFPCDHTVE